MSWASLAMGGLVLQSFARGADGIVVVVTASQSPVTPRHMRAHAVV